MLLAIYCTNGKVILAAIFLNAPRSGKKGLSSACPVQSTKAGRTVVALRVEGFAFCISARASSVSPLTVPKKGVRRPGVKVAPYPET